MDTRQIGTCTSFLSFSFAFSIPLLHSVPFLMLSLLSFGFCVDALVPFPNGKWGCENPAFIYSPVGCVVEVPHRTDCESLGYSWIEGASNKQGNNSIPRNSDR